MVDNYRTLSEFNLKGEFVGFDGDNLKKPKYLQLITQNGEIKLKLPKILRESAVSFLEAGKQINVFGVNKLNLRTGKNQIKSIWDKTN